MEFHENIDIQLGTPPHKFTDCEKDFDPTKTYEWDYLYRLNHEDWNDYLEMHLYKGKAKISQDGIKALNKLRLGHARRYEYFLTLVEQEYIKGQFNHRQFYLPLIRDDRQVGATDFFSQYYIEPLFGVDEQTEYKGFDGDEYKFWLNKITYKITRNNGILNSKSTLIVK